GVNLSPGETQQFIANVTGTTNTDVTWSLNPTIGTISPSGMYTAPTALTTTTTVTVTATSVANGSKQATAGIILVPTGQYSISYTVRGSQVTVTWTSPGGANRVNDSIALSSPGAPNYWYTWNQGTGGATSGSVTINMPPSPGLWEFRYYLGKTYAIAATSNTL